MNTLSPTTIPSATRYRATNLFKRLMRLGRDYPNPNYRFESKVRASFRHNMHLTDSEAIEAKLKLGEFVEKETLALISLAKYRYLKRTYSSPDVSPAATPQAVEEVFDRALEP